jgi:carbonic anhydrase/acetyltransferase-like protein (isoleucine patch superfamily)
MSAARVPDAPVLSLPGIPGPRIDDDVFVAPGARVVGDVSIASGASVWYNAVVRAERAPIVIGQGSNLQDGVAVHVDADSGVSIGAGVSVGHNAVVHGCSIGDGSLIGMGAVILSGAVIGEQCLVAGGAVVLGGTVVPPRSLVAGVPAKVRRSLTDEEVDGLRRNAETYLEYSTLHRAAAATERPTD